jgi:hypothetical protein
LCLGWAHAACSGHDSAIAFNFALEYTIRNVQKKQEGLKLNGAHQLLACSDDINIVGENADTIRKNTKSLLDASKEVGLEVSTEKTKYMLMSRRKKAGQTHSKQMASRSSEDVTKLKYFEITLTDQNCMLEEIKRRLNSVQSFVFPPAVYECNG